MKKFMSKENEAGGKMKKKVLCVMLSMTYVLP